MPTTTDVKLLLAACRQSPEEDTPRLVLADAIEEEGFGGAAAYIRFDITRPPNKSRGRVSVEQKQRIAGYVAWLESLLDEPPTTKERGFYGLGWGDVIVWHVRDGRRCEFYIKRGLPQKLVTDLPMLMENAGRQFLFPLTSCRVVGRKPDFDDLHYPHHYQWVSSTYPQTFNTWEVEPHYIPEPVFKFLKPSKSMRHRGAYPSSTLAHFALDEAAFLFGYQRIEKIT